MIQTHNYPLSNLQLELLQMYSSNISDADLMQINKLIAQYFAQKAISRANKIWDANKWTNKDAEKMVNTHYRTAYIPK